MAALVHDGKRLAMCGDLTAEERRTLESAAIFFVVQQGNSVVRGRGIYGLTEKNEWGACAHLAEQQLSVGKAVAMGTVVVETVIPVPAGNPNLAGFTDALGFTTFTWMQDIMIREGLPPDRQDPCAGDAASPRAQSTS
jgi:hypothetical protein